MTHTEFYGTIKRDEIARAYLFQGEEEYIKEHALKTIHEKLLPKGLEALNACVLNNPSSMDLIAAMETLPVMAERRIVVVRDMEALMDVKPSGEDAGTDRLIGCLSDIPETSCVIFYVKGAPDSRKKLTKALRKHIHEVIFNRLDDATLVTWIARECKRREKSVSRECAAYLGFVAGRDLWMLSQEIAKLAGYLGERQAIARADIDAIITPALECTVFQMVDALVAGREAEAFRLTSALLYMGEEPLRILAMLARQYRNLLHTKRIMEAGGRAGEVAKRVSVPPFVAKRMMAQANGVDARTLRARLDLCVDSDFAVKNGKMRNETALERAMLMISVQAAGK